MIKYKYRWKELTGDGLLKEPRGCGAYYEAESINGYSGGYDSVEEAEQALVEFAKKHKYTLSFRSMDLTLVKITHEVLV